MRDAVRLTPEAFNIDAQSYCVQIEAFIRGNLRSSHRRGIVVPISGGLDSSVVAALCTRAVGKDRVLGLMLPERLGNPEANYYGRLLAKHLGIQTVKINISPLLRGLGTGNLFLAVISGRENWKGIVTRYLKTKDQTAKGLYLDALRGTLDAASRKMVAAVSAKQRARLLVTYKIAEERKLLVAGSSHKTEQMVGLFVKYGIDDGADIMPLKNLYRSQILQLAEYLEIPPGILHRSPNPDILPGITDKYQGYFGMDYRTVELILLGLQSKLSTAEIAGQLGLDEAAVNEMAEIVELSGIYRSHAAAPDLK